MLTPVERAVRSYYTAWDTNQAQTRGFAAINPETLTSNTPADLTFRYIDIGSVTKGVIDWSAVPTLRFEDAPSRARRVARPGDVLISTVRPLLGSHTYADWSDDAPLTVCSTGFAVLRCETDLVSGFAKQLPFSEPVARQLVAWQCGTNYPAVNERDVRRLILPAPSVKEQEAAADLLSAVESAIAANRQAASRARDVERGIVQRFFYDALGETAYADRPRKRLPPDWALVPVEQLLAAKPENGVSPEAFAKPPGRPTFSIAAIRDGQVNLRTDDHLKYVRVADAVASRYALHSGDLLVVRGNANPDLVGRAGFVTEVPDECIFPDITKRVVFKDKGEQTVLPRFAVLAWNSSVIHNQILRRAKTSNGTLKINNRDVRQTVMPVPPRGEQHQLVRAACAAQEQVDASWRVADQLAKLKQSLLHEVLTQGVSANLPPLVTVATS